MKHGMELQPMVAEILRQAQASRDELVPCSYLSYSSFKERPEGALIITPEGGRGEERVFDTTRLSRRQLAEICGIPQVYFERCRQEQPHLLDSNVNTWLAARGRAEQQMVRTLDGRARAVLSDHYRRVDNWEVMQFLAPVIEELAVTKGVRYESLNLSDERLYIKLVTERVTCEVAKGDVVQAGVVISNSEVGCGSLTIAPLVYRLACLNGLIVADASLKKNHVGRRVTHGDNFRETVLSEQTIRADNQALMLKARDLLIACLSEAELRKHAQQMSRLMGMKIDGDPIASVEVLANRFQLMKEEKLGVLTNLLRDSQMTAAGLLNAVTNQSQRVEDYDRATELEMIGGRLLAMTQKDWTPLLTTS